MLEATLRHVIASKSNFLASLWPALEKHPLAKEGSQILPGFIGEMGLEVKGFLAQVEPWLRAGWKIPARRVALYPDGTAFSDTEYFERIDSISQYFGMRKIAATLIFDAPPSPISLSLSGKEGVLEFSAKLDQKNLERDISTEREIRKVYFDRYGSANAYPTRWHHYLTALYGRDNEFDYIGMMGLPPSYQPSAYNKPNLGVFEHIGVQLRNMPWDTFRNSDVATMIPVLAKLSDLLKLPVLVYGLSSDNTIAGYPRTLDIMPMGVDALSAELSYLHRCRLMFSPDSGWTDLMGWLRVPTLLQKQAYTFGFHGLRLFKPKIALLPDDLDELPAVVNQLLSLGENDHLLPDPYQTILPPNKSPVGPVARQNYWENFNR
ncbi:MAG: hypothetical protein ORN21_05365 [Methylophilaceae bacterium]|nr:hypothetical protein [Methylophilaceae bacterium]